MEGERASDFVGWEVSALGGGEEFGKAAHFFNFIKMISIKLVKSLVIQSCLKLISEFSSESKS